MSTWKANNDYKIDGLPRTESWEVDGLSFKVVVHRVPGVDDLWFLTAQSLNLVNYVLHAKLADSAKKEAFELVRHLLKTMTYELEQAEKVSDEE